MIAYCVNCGLSGPVEEFDDDGFTCSGCGSSDIRVKVRRLRTAKRASKEKMTITGMTTLWPTSKRWICTECDFTGVLKDFDHIKDPKDDSNGWVICPQCRAADHVTDAGDEPGCARQATCGFPVKDERRYRRTCFEHSDFTPGKSHRP